MKIFLLAIIVLLSSCAFEIPADYEESKRATIHTWNKRFLDSQISKEQEKEIDNVVVKEVGDIPECGGLPYPGYMYMGCNLGKEILILSYLDERHKMEVCVHEYIHNIASKVYGFSDPEHKSRLMWKRNNNPAPPPFWVTNNNKENIETLAIQELNY